MISWPVARATLRERSRSGLSLLIAGMLTLSSLRSPPEQAFSGFGQALLILFTLLLGAGLLADELESGHAQLVLLRPLTRAAWYGGRFAGAGLALLAGLSIAFAGSLLAALLRGGGDGLGRQLLVLPVAFLWSLSWLSVIAAAGAVARAWTNAGLILIAGVGWALLGGLVRLARPEWGEPIATVGKYLGPMQPLPLGPLEPLAYDLLWLFSAWLAGVLLLNRRELARRHG